MKTLKHMGFGLVLAGLLGLASCQSDMDAPGLQDPKASLTPNTTILELKNLFSATDKVNEIGTKENGEHYIIHGRVVSSDASGNIYKQLCIQDESASLLFSINQRSMYVDNRMGQDVVVDMTGLQMGYYRGQLQVGYPDGSLYDGMPQMGRMAWSFWLQHAERNGLPNNDFKKVRIGDTYPSDQAYVIVMNSFDELNQLPALDLQSQLVEFQNVHWQSVVEANGDSIPYANKEETVSRTLVDNNGQTLTVRNSGYSNFYNKFLQPGKGTVRGILSQYVSSSATWQLTLIDYADVQFSDLGEKTHPYTIADALNPEYQGRMGWINGYIVGSVKAGVTSVTSAADVIFGADAEMENNLLIAASADEKDLSKCVAVELPQGSTFRIYGNLFDNPDNYKKAISVYGTIGQFLGMPAITGCPGSKDDFSIEGVDPGAAGTVPAPSGSGTEADPYNIGYVKGVTELERDVWVRGYVVGYVSAGDYSESSIVWGATPDESSSNWLNASNVVLSEEKQTKAGINNSVPAMLTAAVRPTLGLINNPSILGKRVIVKCRVSPDYLGGPGIRNISEVKIVD